MSYRIKKKLKLNDKLKLIAIILKTDDFSKSQQLKLNVSSQKESVANSFDSCKHYCWLFLELLR